MAGSGDVMFRHNSATATSTHRPTLAPLEEIVPRDWVSWEDPAEEDPREQTVAVGVGTAASVLAACLAFVVLSV